MCVRDYVLFSLMIEAWSLMNGLLILVDAYEIKPVTLLCAGLEELDLAISKGPEEALVTDITHSIQRELRATFLEQYRLDNDSIHLWHTAIVVDESGNLKQVQSGVVLLALSSRIIMIAVNGEDWNCDVDILILVIDVVKGPNLT
jgi:hypothetical protein